MSNAQTNVRPSSNLGNEERLMSSEEWGAEKKFALSSLQKAAYANQTPLLLLKFRLYIALYTFRYNGHFS